MTLTYSKYCKVIKNMTLTYLKYCKVIRKTTEKKFAYLAIGAALYLTIHKMRLFSTVYLTIHKMGYLVLYT